MDDCRNCAHCIFDEIWGECKCKIDKKKHAIDAKALRAKCSYHKKGVPALSQNT